MRWILALIVALVVAGVGYAVVSQHAADDRMRRATDAAFCARVGC